MKKASKMTKIDIKPLSVNDAYRGRRFATPELKKYKEDLQMLLPKMVIPDGPLIVDYEFGVSSKASDGDNLIKAFQDVIADCYGFNDKIIHAWHIHKVLVDKGDEYILFSINSYSD